MLKKLLAATVILTTIPTMAHTLRLPDLITVKSNLSDRRIDRSTIPGRVLLRFSNGVANVGKGRLEIRGGEIVDGLQKAYQRIYYSDGTYTTRFAGYNTYHVGHGHTHFSDFAHYKLREIEGETGVGPIIRSSEKISYCLVDEYIYNSGLPYFRNYRRYNSCGTQVQGISVGWKDVYGKELADQWIDITGLEPGQYWLESTVDPEDKIRESSGSNNTARIKIYLDPTFD